MKNIRKIIIFFLSMAIVALIILIIIKEQDKSNKNKLEIILVDNIEYKNLEVLQICVMEPNGNLVVVPVDKHNNENIYLYVLKLYDHYRNNLPAHYLSPLDGNFEVKKLEQKRDKLYIEIDILYLNNNFNLFLKSLMKSYQYLNISEIEVKVKGEIFNLKKE